MSNILAFGLGVALAGGAWVGLMLFLDWLEEW